MQWSQTCTFDRKPVSELITAHITVQTEHPDRLYLKDMTTYPGDMRQPSRRILNGMYSGVKGAAQIMGSPYPIPKFAIFSAARNTILCAYGNRFLLRGKKNKIKSGT